MFLLSLAALFTSAGIQNVHDKAKFKRGMDILERDYGIKRNRVNPYREKLNQTNKK